MIVAGLGFGVSRMEWALLIIASVAVWSAEAINTAIELLCDHLHPDHHPAIGRVKDVAAAAVLLTASGAFLLGIWVFYPYVLAFMEI